MLTATSRNAWMFFVFRFFTGMGIGGEYAAINSAIDELIPARVRGTVDLLVNGSYWLGTAAGAAATLVLLDPKLLPLDLGWRTCFFMGAVLGLGVLLVRRNLPESPRWLFTHGQADEAERIVDDIERQVGESTGQELDGPGRGHRGARQRRPIGFVEVARMVFGEYPRRSVLGLRCSSVRRSSTTPSSSPIRWCSQPSTTSPRLRRLLPDRLRRWGTSSDRSSSVGCSTSSADGR